MVIEARKLFNEVGRDFITLVVPESCHDEANIQRYKLVIHSDFSHQECTIHCISGISANNLTIGR